MLVYYNEQPVKKKINLTHFTITESHLNEIKSIQYIRVVHIMIIKPCIDVILLYQYTLYRPGEYIK